MNEIKQPLILELPAFQQALLDPANELVDCRPAASFADGFIPGALLIEPNDSFVNWAGLLLDKKKKPLLICEPGTEKALTGLLQQAGLPAVAGFLGGGFPVWKAAGAPTDMIIVVEADELAMDLPHDENLIVVDVRTETEFTEGHVKDAVHLPLQEITDPVLLGNIEDRDNLYIHCSGLYRSVTAASFLKRQGFHNLRVVVGGWDAIKLQKIELVERKEKLN
jgi:rhodanese-related sulfurtransferase